MKPNHPSYKNLKTSMLSKQTLVAGKGFGFCKKSNCSWTIIGTVLHLCFRGNPINFFFKTILVRCVLWASNLELNIFHLSWDLIPHSDSQCSRLKAYLETILGQWYLHQNIWVDILLWHTKIISPILILISCYPSLDLTSISNCQLTRSTITKAFVSNHFPLILSSGFSSWLKTSW